MKPDLVVLAADSTMVAMLTELLGSRHQSLGIAKIQPTFLQHPGHDPGLYADPVSLLRGYVKIAAHALVVLDCAWDGAPVEGRQMVESTIREKLSKAAMDDWAEVVAIEPELENWIWVEPLHLQTVTAWSESTSVNEWLKSTGKWAKGAAKPSDPKAALDDVCQLARVPRSAVIYKYIAAKAGLAKCTDPAFLAMRSILQGWFPPK